jgi:hypothetical protein
MVIMPGSEVRAFQLQLLGLAVTEQEHPRQPVAATGTVPEMS